VWAAPGRVNLIGEHTDYNDGRVLPFALDRATLVAAAPRTDGVLRAATRDLPGGEPLEVALAGLAPGAVRGWGAYVAGAAWALGTGAGADLLVGSAVPVAAGLSSSAALVCATAGALLGLAGRRLEPVELAAAARAAEAEFTGAPVGMMDPLASVLGRPGHALLIDCRSLEVEPLPFDPAAHGLVLIVIDTGVRHAVGEGAYAERRAACEAAARALGVPALRDAAEGDLARLDGVAARRAATSSRRTRACCAPPRPCGRATSPRSGRSCARRTPRCATSSR